MAAKQIRADVKSCGVLVFRDQPEWSFLLMEHIDRWDLPKGHVDPGESERETALRELHEETGIAPHKIELDPNFRFSQHYSVQKKRYGKRAVWKELVVFLGTLPEGDAWPELTLTEHIGYEWFSWAPPHRIQGKSIDPLLNAVEHYWSESGPSRLR